MVGTPKQNLKKALGSVMTGVRMAPGGITGPAKSQGSRDNITVGVRCRPLSKTEL